MIIILQEDQVHHPGADWLFGQCPAQGVGIGSYVTNNRVVDGDMMVGKVYRDPECKGPPSTQVLTEFSNLTKLYDPQSPITIPGSANAEAPHCYFV